MPITKEQQEKLREKLSKLEHEQWEEWSKNIAGNEPISEDRYQRWCKLWKPYSQLTENEKDQDRVYANKIIPIIETLLKERDEEWKEKLRYANAVIESFQIKQKVENAGNVSN